MSVKQFIELVERMVDTYESPTDWRGHDIDQPAKQELFRDALLGSAYKKAKKYVLAQEDAVHLTTE